MISRNDGNYAPEGRELHYRRRKCTKQVTVKVKQFRYRPRGLQEVKVPRFHDNGTGWW